MTPFELFQAVSLTCAVIVFILWAVGIINFKS